MTPEEQLRRLRDPDRWEDTTLTPRQLPQRSAPRRWAWPQPLAVAAAVVVGAGLLFGLGHLVMQSGSSASSAGVADSGAGASSFAASCPDVGALSAAPVPFAPISAADTAGGSSAGTPSTTPSALADLSASIAVPTRVRAGTTADYVVTLKNTSSHAVSLAPCPDYVESVVMDSARVTRTYRLNCGQLASVPPSHSVEFAMRIPLPAHTTGDATLSWLLDGTQEATATTKVVPN